VLRRPRGTLLLDGHLSIITPLEEPQRKEVSKRFGALSEEERQRHPKRFYVNEKPAAPSRRSSDLFDPVDGLKRLPKGWCLNKVFNFEKWSDKRDHLHVLATAVDAPRLAMDEGYSNLVPHLIRLLKYESNIPVVTEAAKCSGLMAKGLRRDFERSARQILPVMLGRINDKSVWKPNCLIERVEQLLWSMPFELFIEELKPQAASKSSFCKKEAICLLSRTLDSSAVQHSCPEAARKCLEPICVVAFSAIDDSDSTVRQEAARLLADIALRNRASPDLTEILEKMPLQRRGVFEEAWQKIAKEHESPLASSKGSTPMLRGRRSLQDGAELPRRRSRLCAHVDLPTATPTSRHSSPVSPRSPRSPRSPPMSPPTEPRGAARNMPSHALRSRSPKSRSRPVSPSASRPASPRFPHTPPSATRSRYSSPPGTPRHGRNTARVVSSPNASPVVSALVSATTPIAAAVSVSSSASTPVPAVVPLPTVSSAHSVSISSLPSSSSPVSVALPPDSESPATLPATPASSPLMPVASPVAVARSGVVPVDAASPPGPTSEALPDEPQEGLQNPLIRQMAEEIRMLRSTVERLEAVQRPVENSADVLAAGDRTPHERLGSQRDGKSTTRSSLLTPRRSREVIDIPPSPGVSAPNSPRQTLSRRRSIPQGPQVSEVVRISRPLTPPRFQDAEAEGKAVSSGGFRVEVPRQSKVARQQKDATSYWGVDHVPQPAVLATLKEMFRQCVDEELVRHMFSDNMEDQLSSLQAWRRQVSLAFTSLVEVMDLVLKWVTWLLFNTNTQIWKACLELLAGLADGMATASVELTDREASILIPSLIERSGHNMPTIRESMVLILRQYLSAYSNIKALPMLLHGLASKNKRSAGCALRCIGDVVDRHVASALTRAPKDLAMIARFLDDKDADNRRAAQQLFASLSPHVETDVFNKILGTLPGSIQSVIRAAATRLSLGTGQASPPTGTSDSPARSSVSGASAVQPERKDSGTTVSSVPESSFSELSPSLSTGPFCSARDPEITARQEGQRDSTSSTRSSLREVSSQLASNSSEEFKVACEALVPRIKVLERSAVAAETHRAAEALLLAMQTHFGGHSDIQWCGPLVAVMEDFCSLKDFIRLLPVGLLKSMLRELLRNLDHHSWTRRVEDGAALLRKMNLACVMLLNSMSRSCACGLILELGILESDVASPSLVTKCLRKAQKGLGHCHDAREEVWNVLDALLGFARLADQRLRRGSQPGRVVADPLVASLVQAAQSVASAAQQACPEVVTQWCAEHFEQVPSGVLRVLRELVGGTTRQKDGSATPRARSSSVRTSRKLSVSCSGRACPQGNVQSWQHELQTVKAERDSAVAHVRQQTEAEMVELRRHLEVVESEKQRLNSEVRRLRSSSSKPARIAGNMSALFQDETAKQEREFPIGRAELRSRNDSFNSEASHGVSGTVRDAGPLCSTKHLATMRQPHMVNSAVSKSLPSGVTNKALSAQQQRHSSPSPLDGRRCVEGKLPLRTTTPTRRTGPTTPRRSRTAQSPLKRVSSSSPQRNVAQIKPAGHNSTNPSPRRPRTCAALRGG